MTIITFNSMPRSHFTMINGQHAQNKHACYLDHDIKLARQGLVHFLIWKTIHDRLLWTCKITSKNLQSNLTFSQNSKTSTFKVCILWATWSIKYILFRQMLSSAHLQFRVYQTTESASKYFFIRNFLNEINFW